MPVNQTRLVTKHSCDIVDELEVIQCRDGKSTCEDFFFS